MGHMFSENQLSLLSDFVKTRTALHFPRDRWNDLENKTLSASREMGFSDPSAFLHWLVSSPLSSDQLEILASNLTISETYLWREPQTFEALMNEILPPLIRKLEHGEKRLRIWSAGCATGEEPFSLAIALHKVIQNPADWNITILATDFNLRALRKAMNGVYSEWSFRNTPKWLKKYFHPRDDVQFEVSPEIRKMVTFGYLNLAEDIYPSPINNTNAMDIIFCRNVLMYFAHERSKQVARNFFSALVEGGWLIVSGGELADQLFPQFSPITFPGIIFYQKSLETATPQETLSAKELPPSPPPEFDSATVMPVPVPVPVPDRGPPDQPDQARAHAIRFLANQGKLVEALALCEKAIALNRLDPSLYFLQATILQEWNKGIEAIASLRRAIYLDPNFVLAHFAMGNLLLRQGNARGAKASFENVIDLLSASENGEIVPESDGLTAGRLGEIVKATIQTGELP